MLNNKQEIKIKNDNICKITGKICIENKICKYCSIAVYFQRDKENLNKNN